MNARPCVILLDCLLLVCKAGEQFLMEALLSRTCWRITSSGGGRAISTMSSVVLKLKFTVVLKLKFTVVLKGMPISARKPFEPSTQKMENCMHPVRNL